MLPIKQSNSSNTNTAGITNRAQRYTRKIRDIKKNTPLMFVMSLLFKHCDPLNIVKLLKYNNITDRYSAISLEQCLGPTKQEIVELIKQEAGWLFDSSYFSEGSYLISDDVTSLLNIGDFGYFEPDDKTKEKINTLRELLGILEFTMDDYDIVPPLRTELSSFTLVLSPNAEQGRDLAFQGDLFKNIIQQLDDFTLGSRMLLVSSTVLQLVKNIIEERTKCSLWPPRYFNTVGPVYKKTPLFPLRLNTSSVMPTQENKLRLYVSGHVNFGPLSYSVHKLSDAVRCVPVWGKMETAAVVKRFPTIFASGKKSDYYMKHCAEISIDDLRAHPDIFQRYCTNQNYRHQLRLAVAHDAYDDHAVVSTKEVRALQAAIDAKKANYGGTVFARMQLNIISVAAMMTMDSFFIPTFFSAFINKCDSTEPYNVIFKIQVRKSDHVRAISSNEIEFSCFNCFKFLAFEQTREGALISIATIEDQESSPLSEAFDSWQKKRGEIAYTTELPPDLFCTFLKHLEDSLIRVKLLSPNA